MDALNTAIDAMELSCSTLGTRGVNHALRRLPSGAVVRVREPAGRHNLAVALREPLDVHIDGHAGYYVGGLGRRANVYVHGSAGWGAGENLMSGTVRVHGHAGQSTGASAHGGMVVVEGSAGARTAISLKGGTVAVAGDIGDSGAFMAQAGVLLVGGDAGHHLGDSLYEAVIFVAGSIASLGADARVTEMDDDATALARTLIDAAGFDHVDPQELTRVESARALYHFDALAAQRY